MLPSACGGNAEVISTPWWVLASFFGPCRKSLQYLFHLMTKVEPVAETSCVVSTPQTMDLQLLSQIIRQSRSQTVDIRCAILKCNVTSVSAVYYATFRQ